MWKTGKFLKTEKKIWNLVVLEPENNKFRFKNGIETKFQINRMKKHSFLSDTKLQVDQIKKKLWRKSSLSLFWFKNQFKKVEFFLKVEMTINFQVKTKGISLELLRKPTGPVTPELSFDIFCSLLIKIGIFQKKTDWLQYEFFLACNSPRWAYN